MNIALPVQSAASTVELVASAPSITNQPTTQDSDSQSAVTQIDGKPEKSASTSPEPKRAYPAPASTPTQGSANGVRFDFNDGARIVCPQGEQPWQIRIRDLDTGNVLFETEFAGGYVNSSKRYYVRFGIEVLQQGERVVDHQYSAKDRDVLIQFPVGTLGDPMRWFPYAVKFKEKHGCKLSCAMGAPLIALFRDAYPDIEFVTHEEVKPE
ncbi:MAG TPA: hypothetical protein VG274_05835, partial [Rhizomicrobium sp.]|nr:hypothetical protein [Rhizomicrobium sp.]